MNEEFPYLKDAEEVVTVQRGPEPGGLGGVPEPLEVGMQHPAELELRVLCARDANHEVTDHTVAPRIVDRPGAR